MSEIQARVYELQQGEWIELDATAPRPSTSHRVIGMVAGALAIAVMAAITIVAAALTALLLPVGLLIAWLASRRRATPGRGAGATAEDAYIKP